jgi:hypothetical protein
VSDTGNSFDARFKSAFENAGCNDPQKLLEQIRPILNEQMESYVRMVFEKICRDTLDTQVRGRRTTEFAMVLDCPCVKGIPVADVAKKFGISRERQYTRVNKSAYELAEIKGKLGKF